MRNVLFSYVSSTKESFEKVYVEGSSIIPIINRYRDYLKGFSKIVPPRAIIFHDLESATEIFSDHSLPAWTDGEFIHVDPVREDWKDIFISSIPEDVPEKEKDSVMIYYLSLDVQDVASIVGHELTHCLNVFQRTFENDISDSQWFEEGFCFYLSRRMILTPTKFDSITGVENLLIKHFQDKVVQHPLWEFGAHDDGEWMSFSLYDYWRATSTVRILVEDYANGSVEKILKLFDYWSTHLFKEERLFDYLLSELEVPEGKRNQLEY